MKLRRYRTIGGCYPGFPGFIVARVKRSVTRGGVSASQLYPDYALLHPGYKLSAIHRVIDRCFGSQPSAAAAWPRTRLLEPREENAMLRPPEAMASSADQDCAAPRPSLAAMALAISPKASSPLSTNMKVRAGALASAST